MPYLLLFSVSSSEFIACFSTFQKSLYNRKVSLHNIEVNTLNVGVYHLLNTRLQHTINQPLTNIIIEDALLVSRRASSAPKKGMFSNKEGPFLLSSLASSQMEREITINNYLQYLLTRLAFLRLLSVILQGCLGHSSHRTSQTCVSQVEPHRGLFSYEVAQRLQSTLAKVPYPLCMSIALLEFSPCTKRD